MDRDRIFQELAHRVYPDCSNADQIESDGFHIDSVTLGYLMAKGYSYAEAKHLVKVFNGEVE